jgi:hypothetical protein
MYLLLLRTSQCIFLGGHGDSRDSSTSFTALLASNLLAQFSRQIFIQIFGLESPKVCENLAVASYGKSQMFIDGHLEHKCSFPKMAWVR